LRIDDLPAEFYAGGFVALDDLHENAKTVLQVELEEVKL